MVQTKETGFSILSHKIGGQDKPFMERSKTLKDINNAFKGFLLASIDLA
jgi:hypothetical protein